MPLTVAAIGLALPASATAAKKPKVVGHVYTETNDPKGNQVIIFKRFSNGRLKKSGVVSTGGNGGQQPQPGCTPVCPFLDTQNEVVLTNDRKLLFAVNAGSSSISSFRVTRNGLKLVNVIASNGKAGHGFPNSLTVHGNLLYVLNSDAANISGFAFSKKGKLSPIAGSTRAIPGKPIPGISRQIGFDNTGNVLMVTLLATQTQPPPVGGTDNTIATFPVNSHGQAQPGTSHNSTGKFPFAFAFNKQNQSIVVQVNELTPTAGTAQRYRANGSPIGGGVTTVDFAPCWVVVTKNGRHVYIVNTGGGAPGGGTVVAYKSGRHGALRRLRATKALNEFVKTDEALSADDHFLYVVVPAFGGGTSAPGPDSRIDEYAVRRNGTLRLIGSTLPVVTPGLSGLAAT